MASKTEICNMALSNLGVGKEIANLDTEQSAEASACRRYYDQARDATLRDFAWPFAQKRRALSLIEMFTVATAEWTYSYRYPFDCVRIHRIMSGIRNDTRQSRVSYEILKDDAARILYTDEADAMIEYTERVEDPSFYPADFEIAFSFRLSALVAPRLSKGDPFGLRASAMNTYMEEISRAKAASANEVQRDELPISEFERSRD